MLDVEKVKYVLNYHQMLNGDGELWKHSQVDHDKCNHMLTT